MQHGKIFVTYIKFEMLFELIIIFFVTASNGFC